MFFGSMWGSFWGRVTHSSRATSGWEKEETSSIDTSDERRGVEGATSSTEDTVEMGKAADPRTDSTLVAVGSSDGMDPGAIVCFRSVLLLARAEAHG